MDDITYPYTILFVEDEDMIRQNYVSYLKDYFQVVYEAQNAEDAFLIYKSKTPDIMIVDIHLPKMNGIELVRRIREKDYNTKVIMLTAFTDTKLLLDATSLQLTKYLVKPINRQELKDTLRLAINEIKSFTVTPNKNIALNDEYIWDIEIKELKYHNQIVELTYKEKSFLELLLSHKSRVFSHDEILEAVWGYDEIGTINSLKNLVKRLRKKLPEDTIVNLFNEGYKIKLQ
ncbi:MAG: response regulator transcription factor [Arcobacteraceae bacterium]|nr:response regulator transcription factor [Arcobacteraceae bacterium]